MKFSIIIPAYNEEKYLPGCLESVSRLNYSKDEYEIILVDNGSSDDTIKIAESYGAKVLIDNSKTVSGLRNLGASAAKGEILAFVDADCLVDKDWLKQAEVYSADDAVRAWGSPPVIPVNASWVQEVWYLVRQKMEEVQEVDWLESMNLFVQKDIFISINGFNEKLVTCEDVDFCYRLRKYGSIISDKKIKVVHLGEAETVSEFMKKEIWRGRSNLAGILSHGLSINEMTSLSIPLYFGLLLPVTLVIFMVIFDHSWLWIWVVIYLFPSFVLLLKLRKKKITFKNLGRLLFLVQVYFFSRTIAVLKKN